MIRTIGLCAAIAAVVMIAFAPSVRAQSTPPTFRMYSVDGPAPPKPAPAADCAGMESRLETALSAFDTSCKDQRYRSRLQHCLTVQKQLLAAAEQLLPHTGTCQRWTAAGVRGDISAARKNLAIITDTIAAENSPRTRRGSTGGYSGSNNNNYVGPNIGYSACQRFMIQADGSKFCY